ncbi:MAG TPA: hypothetical protein VKF15_00055 [Nitrososphaerales archaeon]|nr:hypothetical protein [Nitrososphaerales archaeon]
MEILQEVAGSSSAVLFLRMGSQDWTPVGEETLFAVVGGKNSTAAVVICDGEGNSKAISGWVPAEKAEAIARSLDARGVSKFQGEVKLPT